MPQHLIESVASWAGLATEWVVLVAWIVGSLLTYVSGGLTAGKVARAGIWSVCLPFRCVAGAYRSCFPPPEPPPPPPEMGETARLVLEVLAGQVQVVPEMSNGTRFTILDCGGGVRLSLDRDGDLMAVSLWSGAEQPDLITDQLATHEQVEIGKAARRVVEDYRAGEAAARRSLVNDHLKQALYTRSHAGKIGGLTAEAARVEKARKGA